MRMRQLKRRKEELFGKRFERVYRGKEKVVRKL